MKAVFALGILLFVLRLALSIVAEATRIARPGRPDPGAGTG